MLIKIHITKVIMFSQLVWRNKQRMNDKGVKENECQRSERDAHVQVLSTILLACSSRCRSRLLLMFYNCMTYAQMLLSRRNQAHYNQPDNGPFITFWKINDSLKWIFELETISLQPSLIVTCATLIILNITTLINRSWRQHRSQTTYCQTKNQGSKL